MNIPIRTRSCVLARKEIVERFSLPPHVSFVDAARELIQRDHLYADPPADRLTACKFLTVYYNLKKYTEIKPLPKSKWL